MPAKTKVNADATVLAHGPRRKLVLASSSLYRRRLLERLRLPFAVVAPDADESPLPGETPAETVVRLAEAKARSVVAHYPDALIIGSDQVADCDGVAVGKPRNHADATAQLAMLAGKTVVFRTGLALLDATTNACQTARVDVASTFRTLDADEIESYLRRDQPYDCAGSVKVERLGIALFSRIASDDPTALIGLPLIRLTEMLRAAGMAVV